MNEADAVVHAEFQPSPDAALAEARVSPPAATDHEPRSSMADVQESINLERQRTVPYGALAEERARRKELQRELQSAIDSQQRLQGRLDLLHELAQQQGAAEVNTEPEVALEHADARHDDLPAEAPLSDADSQAGAQFRTQVMHSVLDVMRERPDFLAAYQYARQARVSELCALGYAPQEALAITFDNEAEIIGNAFAAGHNPAQVIYDYAQRHGYRGGPGPVQHGTRMPPGPAPAMSEAEKVALAARGQAASKSLSNAGGGSAGALTLEALAGMSDEEFAEATKGDRWQKLLR
jgi:hypothetical protein